jgi:NAD(P)-dependent dehydrogenase (short-subunit alcohol dehydrogenase family)
VSRVLVTGAARGLGLGLVEALCERGDEVVAACRTTSPELEATGADIATGIDLAEPGATAQLEAALRGVPLDVVVCNAGVNLTFADAIDDLRLELVEYELQVNTLGALRTVKAALPLLQRGSKILLITTQPAGIGPQAVDGGIYGYRLSKAAMTTFGYILALDLRPRGIAVRMVDPGPVATHILRSVAAAGYTTLDPDRAPAPLTVARDLLQRIDELTLETTGQWVKRRGGPAVSAT